MCIIFVCRVSVKLGNNVFQSFGHVFSIDQKENDLDKQLSFPFWVTKNFFTFKPKFIFTSISFDLPVQKSHRVHPCLYFVQ